MKRMWIALALLVLTVSSCAVGITYTRSVTARMTQTVSQAKAAQKKGNAAAACRLSEQAKKDWKDAHRVLCVYMVHERLEALDETLAVMPELCRNGAKEEFLSECDRGLMQIAYLNESETPNLENVF